MNYEITINVEVKAPINRSFLNIDMISPGWQTVKFNVYSKGVSHPENIPDLSNEYILNITYNNSLSYSIPIQKIDYTEHVIDLNFIFYQESSSIRCFIQSNAIIELSQTINLRDRETDFLELMKFYKNKMEEERE